MFKKKKKKSLKPDRKTLILKLKKKIYRYFLFKNIS